MANFAINIVYAVPDISISDSRAVNVKTPMTVPTTLWDSARPLEFTGGQTKPDQSNYPCGFRSPAGAATKISLAIRGFFNFDGTWRQAGARYVVRGSLPAAPAQVFESDPVAVPPAGSNEVSAIGFKVLTPALAKRQASDSIPYRFAGDWTWTISHLPPPGPPPVPQATSVSTTATSRLELYFFYGNAPVLPFPGSYPIGLLRQFIPSGYEVEALIISDLGTGYIRKKYAQRVIQTIWNYGSNNPFTLLQYDCVNGSSKYVQSYQGGSFSIHHWMNKTRATCNCYDLAAISYLAYLILANCMNNPAWNPAWIYRSIFGYIKPGPLIGWPQYPNCNSPFWARPPVGGIARLQNYANPMDPQRTFFSNHAWVEAVMDALNVPLAIDACHALQPVPPDPNPILSYGTQPRSFYFAAGLESGASTATWAPPTISTYAGVTSIDAVI